MDAILKMLDERIAAAEKSYRTANDDVELYLQGRWEEALALRERIAAMANIDG